MIKELTSAIRTLSILPVPGSDADNLSSSFPWFPLVGAVLGLILYGISLAFIFLTGGVWPEVVALIILICGIILTRAFHLDGLADWGDAFWGAWTREKTLDIMKDTNIGVFAVLTLIVVLLSKWVALTHLVSQEETIWIIAAFIVSRAVIVELAVRLPYARPNGGTGAPFVEDAPSRYRLLSFFTTLGLLLFIYGSAGVIPLLLGWFVNLLFGFWAYGRVGGVTGDILGACCETTETLILLISAALVI